MSKTYAAKSSTTVAGGPRAGTKSTYNRGAQPRPRAAAGAGAMSTSGRKLTQTTEEGNKLTQTTEEGNKLTQTTEQQGQATHQDGYSKFSPNEKKRQQITEQARREEAAYEQHKSEKTALSFSYCGTPGGGSVPESTVRSQQERLHRNAKFTNLDKQRKWKEEQKHKNQAEIDEKRLRARKQAELNEESRHNHDRKQKDKWKVDMRSKNEEFLKQFESQAAKAAQSTSSKSQLSPPTGAAAVTGKLTFQPESPVSERRKQPPMKGKYSRSPYREDTDSNEDEEDLVPHYTEDIWPDRQMLHQTDRATWRLEEEKLSQLQSMFPQHNRDYLLAMLCQADYSVENAIAFLTED